MFRLKVKFVFVLGLALAEARTEVIIFLTSHPPVSGENAMDLACTTHNNILANCLVTGGEILDRCGNDPSAGSPTETLLRLHLPLDDKVQTSSRDQNPIKELNHNPEASPDHPIGRCDGRCVQRAGT
jgi:hypothetical protein